MMDGRHKIKGVSLIELLLVAAIIASALTIYLKYIVQNGENVRIDRTLTQIQQIETAAKAYYIANGTWPGSNCTAIYTLNAAGVSLLQPDYLPDTALPTPWGGTTGGALYYKTYFCSDPNFPGITNTITNAITAGVPLNTWVVEATIGTSPQRVAIGKMIAGRLPAAIFVPSSGVLYSWVPIPNKVLNNLAEVKFGGIYYHGGCVPVPVCPTTTSGNISTTPQLFLVPISVSGQNDTGSQAVYPISSFTAYTSGPSAANPVACNTGGSQPACTGGNATGLYWRACIQIITEHGDVSATRTDTWGNIVSIAAFTRCALPNEKAGSDLTVYGN